tara:strand:+ start:653 stop:1336 length:684 start_codon:yes stop_codon:yes gene_type:complete
MSFIAVGIGLSVAGTVAGVVSANKEIKAAERREAAALEEHGRMEDAYSQLDTSNPYSYMENKMDNLQVDKRAFDLQIQKLQQKTGDVLTETKESTGSSGVAAVAQALSEEGKVAIETAGSTVGMQEQSNQNLERNMATNLQFKEREGEIYSRNQKKDMAGTLLGMSQQEVAAYKEQVAAANEAKWKAISGGVESVGNMLVQPPGASGAAFATKKKKYTYPTPCNGLV